MTVGEKGGGVLKYQSNTDSAHLFGGNNLVETEPRKNQFGGNKNQSGGNKNKSGGNKNEFGGNKNKNEFGGNKNISSSGNNQFSFSNVNK